MVVSFLNITQMIPDIHSLSVFDKLIVDVVIAESSSILHFKGCVSYVAD